MGGYGFFFWSCLKFVWFGGKFWRVFYFECGGECFDDFDDEDLYRWNFVVGCCFWMGFLVYWFEWVFGSLGDCGGIYGVIFVLMFYCVWFYCFFCWCCSDYRGEYVYVGWWGGCGGDFGFCLFYVY